MIKRMPIRRGCDRARVHELCQMLIESDDAGPKGKMLGEEVRAQVDAGYIGRSTYERLSRWCHPEAAKPHVQPVAEAISYELFGFVITRMQTATA
jgi:hypothetical protein